MLAISLLQGLKDHGAREIFGIPGDFVLPFFKVIEESGILPHYTLSHEPAVGFAADAAARYHAGLGVAVVTYGAGAFNLVNAIAGAYAERSPVVVIAGAPGARERTSGFALHHQARSIDTQTGGLPGDHLRPGRADRCRYRAGGDRARAAQRPRTVAAGLYRAAARHDGGAGRGGAGASRGVQPIPTRSPSAPTRSSNGWRSPAPRSSSSTWKFAATISSTG